MNVKTVQVSEAMASDARSVAMLVQIASRFEAAVFIEKGSKDVNVKSIMGMMAMGFLPGETLKITASGLDEDAALEEIAGFITKEQ